MKGGIFLRGLLRRGMLQMHRNRPLASSAAVAAIPLEPGSKGFNVVENKFGSQNAEGNLKVLYGALYARNTRDLVITSVPQSIPGYQSESAWIAEASENRLLDTPGFPVRIPTPRHLDLYEMRRTSDMGLGLFAKRDMKRGELILAERPLLVASLGMQKAVLTYTDLPILELRITEFKSLLEAAISRLSPESQAAFNALHNESPSDHLLGIMFSNGYCVTLYDGSLSSIIVCKVGARINHSCTPNAQFAFQPGSFSMQLHAACNIKAGDQLFVSYGSPSSSFAERRAGLAPHGIVCKCRACINATPQADQLRGSFESEIFRLADVATREPFKIDQTMLERALMLEKEMVKEGLDIQPRFGLLLNCIALMYARLGNVKECDAYTLRGEDFCYCEMY